MIIKTYILMNAKNVIKGNTSQAW